MEDPIAYIKQNYLSKVVKVTTLNDRVFYGKFSALDDKCNLLLQESVAEVESNQFNKNLSHAMDMQVQAQKYLSLDGFSQEQKDQIMGSFAHNKFYMGHIMINGADIKKVEIQQTKN